MSISERGLGRKGRLQAGLTFIELILFIIIVGIGIAGILGVMNFTTSKSADPLIAKQALAIAESLLEEIQSQPFTNCDPDDANFADPTTTACASLTENFGPETGEKRVPLASESPFDNVNDYVIASGVETEIAIVDVVDGTALSDLAPYNAYVKIVNESVGGVPAADSLRIDVRVTHDNGTEVVISGYRLRYAPKAA
jgi:MSHA pilin protein MshD